MRMNDLFFCNCFSVWRFVCSGEAARCFDRNDLLGFWLCFCFQSYFFLSFCGIVCFFRFWCESCCLGCCLSMFTLRFCWFASFVVFVSDCSSQLWPVFPGCISLVLQMESASLMNLILASTILVFLLLAFSPLNRMFLFFLGYCCTLLEICKLPCVSIFSVLMFVCGVMGVFVTIAGSLFLITVLFRVSVSIVILWGE